jgi:uncharacterized YccA/Bax inhibitor family protein
MKYKFIKTLIFVFVISLVGAGPAYAAYIDPNTGGMLFQVLAVLFGVFSAMILVFSSKIKMVFYRITRFFREKNTDESSEVGTSE